MTAKELILNKLKWSAMPLAVHEFHIEGYSENNIATRLSELVAEGKLKCDYRRGERYKEWSLQRYENQQGLLF